MEDLQNAVAVWDCCSSLHGVSDTLLDVEYKILDMFLKLHKWYKNTLFFYSVRCLRMYQKQAGLIKINVSIHKHKFIALLLS